MDYEFRNIFQSDDGRIEDITWINFVDDNSFDRDFSKASSDSDLTDFYNLVGHKAEDMIYR